MKKVVVLGAGYASLSFIKDLPANVYHNAEIVLISEKPYHYNSILLHEVVSGAADKSVLFPLKDILPKKITFIEDTVTEIKKDEIVGAKSTYSYDYLVVGLGFNSDSFNIPGIKENASALENYEGAKAIHNQIRDRFKNDTNTAKPLHFVICGGGFSGIELIASFAQEVPKLCKEFNVDKKNVKLTCVEAMPNILPMFSEKLAQKALEYLHKLGVECKTSCKVLSCETDGIMVEYNNEQSKLEADLVIWTAGVKGNKVIENSPFFTSKKSKVEVNAYLRPINQENQADMDNIFVFGDCSALLNPENGRFYAPTAQIAGQQGQYLASVFSAILSNSPVKEFTFQSQGTLCSLGEDYAVGVVGEKTEIKGKFSLMLKNIVESRWKVKLKGFKSLFEGK